MPFDLESTIGQAIGGDTRVPPDVQRSRDADRVRILQNERSIELGNPDAAARTRNLAALDTELRAMGAPPAQAAVSTPASDLFDTIDAAVKRPAIPKGAEPPPKPTIGDQALDAVTMPARTGLQTATALASSTGQAIIGGWRGLSALVSGAGLDEAARQVQNPELAGGQTAKAYEPASGSPAETATKIVSIPGEVVAGAGRIAGRATMDVTGSPLAATAVETGVNAVPLLAVKSGKPSAQVPAREIPTAMAKDATNYDVPTYQRRAQAARGAQAESAPAPEVAPFSEPVEAAPGKSLPPAQQAARAAVLQRVGINEPHPGAISGDAKAAANEYQQSKLESPSGNFVKAKLDAERQALENHADQIVRDTGGTPGVDSHALDARGQTIISPLEAFKQWFTDKTNALYAEARNRAQGQPLALDRFNEVLGTDSKFANTDTIELRKGITARMKELGMIDKDGNLLPATVDQAENLRQYVNEEWSPKSNGRIRELKNALDEDVTSAAGEDLFKAARDLHAAKQRIFADPKGLSSILESEGINRKVPIEKVADTVANLPNAQFAQIVNTLKLVPDELRPQAQAALSEIKAHMASRMIEAAKGRQAQWGARDVTTYLNKNALKLESVFSPEEMGKIRDLNDAGHILRIDTSYPGAAVQKANLLKRSALGIAHSVAATAGGVVGGVLGSPRAGAAIAGEGARAFTSRLDETAALREAQKRWVRLSDVGASK